jgi:hypothetical protein
MNSQTENPGEPTERPAELPGRFEAFVRRLFERIGGALDFALRRPLNPQPRTDLTALIPPIERAIEEKLRRTDARVIAPNLIELRYDYETYSQLTKPRVEYLRRELRATIYEYIHNRRYATLSDVQVTVTFDVFTRGLVIKARFPDEAVAQNEAKDEQASESAASAVQAEKRCEVTLRPVTGSRFGDFRITLSAAAAPAGLGRSRSNRISIDDPTVSSIHAAITLNPSGSVVLTDLGSSNGTFVNGVPIVSGDKTIIRSGDRLRFGEVETIVEIGDPN